ncbi:MAG: AAA family ATPase [Planctomycetaceae bacterium]|nr:AAA family ATPase [Planctomycetaceae bacterium]
MSQQVPPNNSATPQGNTPQGSHPQEGDVVVASGYTPQGAGSAQHGGGLPSAYGTQNYARNRVPMIDPIESAKLTPQLMVLLVFSGLRRHWKWSLPAALFLGLLAGAGLYFLLPVQHEAASHLRIQAFRETFIVADDRRQGRYEDFVNTQIALLKNPNVIDRALENPDVARLPIILAQGTDRRGWLTRNLSVSNIRNSEIVKVSIATDRPDTSEKIVDAVVVAYLSFIDEIARSTNNAMMNNLRIEYNRQRLLANNLQEGIRRKTREAVMAGVQAGDGGMSVGIAQGESLARDVAIANARLTAMRAQRKGILKRMDDPSTIPTSMLINSNPELRTLSENRNLLVQKKESFRQSFSNPNDPLILQIDRQIAIIDDRIKNLGSDGDQGASAAMLEHFHFVEEVNLYQLDMEILVQEILVADLTERYHTQLVKGVERTESVLDVEFETAQLSRSNNTLDRIEDRILAVSTELRAPGHITPLSQATPITPSRWRQVALVGGGAAILAFFPLLLSIAVERMKPRLYHVSQVRRGIPQVLIGEIMEPPVSWVHGATFRKRLARYRESVHNWCTHLLLSDPFRSCKTLSVASVAGDDGKTFLAVQVAVAMAQMKSGKVLLIDGDMRVGRLHLLFGNEEAGVGLADVLSFRSLPGEAIVQNEKEPNLELLSAGQLDMSPYELLGDGRFRELLDALEESPTNPHGYSLIIVVLPPVANAAESLIMAASTDSTLLCVRQGETVLAAMEDVYRKLVNTGAAVDGIVVKDIPYYQMAGRDGGFADRLEQIRLSHLMQYAD